jgi:hypothetical protein
MPRPISCVLVFRGFLAYFCLPLNTPSMFTHFKVKCFRYDYRKTHKFINGSLLKLNYLIW